MPCSSLNQYKITNTVDLILIGNRPSSFSVSLVLAYLDTPTEYLQKLESGLDKSGFRKPGTTRKGYWATRFRGLVACWSTKIS